MTSDLPVGIDAFLARAGWAGALIEPLPGDASFRRYFRVRRGDDSAMLMHAPPPQEDPQPFLRAAAGSMPTACARRISWPRKRARAGSCWKTLATSRMREYVDAWPQDEDAVYRAAIDTLVQLAQLPAGPFTAYGMAEYLREVRLFIEWFCPARALYVDAAGFQAAWEQVLAPLLPAQRPGVTVLRDYHAENIMLLGGLDAQGLLDFQDALAGHPAYDLVSLLQDARREVSPELEARMFDYYVQKARPQGDFLADYARLGAQRNTKIVGIFVRLWKRDGKARYLDYIPRVWAMLERDLAHPALAPVAAWFDANIPADLRDPAGRLGGSFAA
jgi:aminoglycoside/choline kinase family phosphotransferase